MASATHSIDALLRGGVIQPPQLELTVLFDSVACGQTHVHSGLDLAVKALQPLTGPTSFSCRLLACDSAYGLLIY
jgi:hypothetical protein